MQIHLEKGDHLTLISKRRTISDSRPLSHAFEQRSQPSHIRFVPLSGLHVRAVNDARGDANVAVETNRADEINSSAQILAEHKLPADCKLHRPRSIKIIPPILRTLAFRLISQMFVTRFCRTSNQISPLDQLF